MAYKITPYTYKKAKKYGVKVKPSTLKGKKIDVYKKGIKVASVGSLGYSDYPTYLKTKGKTFANKRKIAYKKRHQQNRTKKGTNGWYADKLLW
jgi:hypothetical protein